MKYQDAIKAAMTRLARDPLFRALGYNVGCGNKANQTLVNVPQNQLIETPAAENLIVGLATGLALKGFKPLVWIERFDFVLNGLDALANHLGKLAEISRGEFAPKVIVRTCVGAKKNGLKSGPTHNSDYTEAFDRMLPFPVLAVRTPEEVETAYHAASVANTSFMIVEYRDLYT